MITYYVQEENLYHTEIGFYTSFGILALQNDKLIGHVSDVFEDREKADTFVKLCNESQLDIIHLYDVIDDALS